MQHLALFFLLAVTASMIFSFEVQVLAQEAPVEPSGEEMPEETTEGETMEDEMVEAEMMEDEIMEEEPVMEETMEEVMEEVEEDVDSPLEQMTSGVDPHEIQCKTGQKLVFKASNWRPACVNESSFDILAIRGWVSSHDPSHEELTKMVDDYMMAHPEEVEEEVEEEIVEETQENPGEIEIEEGVDVEGDTTVGNGTEGEVEPQSYEIDLSESMDMGAQ
ncbi:MAG: hypothetical protein ACT4NT_07905 [Nitrososphaerota archaeon]